MLQKLRNFLRRNRLDDDFREEMEFHLASRTQDGVESGMSQAEARRAAERRFGNQGRIGEATRQTWGFGLLESTIHDFRYAARVLRKHPLATSVAVGSLAIGIGMSTALLTIMDGVLLRPPPLYVEGEELVQVGYAEAGPTRWTRRVPAATYQAWSDSSVDAEFAAAGPQAESSVRFENYPESARSQRISPRMLPLVGVTPSLGRNFEPDDARIGAPAVALISHGMWARRFEQDPDIVGRRLWIDGADATIVGVMPERFWLIDPGIGMWMPLQLGSIDPSNASPEVEVFARRPRSGAKRLQAALDTALSRAEEFFPEQERGRTVVQVPMIGLHMFGSQAGPGTSLMAGAIALALLIVCLNVGNIMVARWTARQQEGAVRVALGAGRMRLIRQFLTESVLISVLGGVGALLVTYWGLKVILLFAPPAAVFYDFGIDARILAFVAGVTVVAGLAAGVLPAIFDSKTSVNENLKQGASHSSSKTPKQRLRSSLVVVEVAGTVALLVAVGSMVRTYVRVGAEDPGFEPAGLVSFRVDLPVDGFVEERRTDFRRYEQGQGRLIDRLASLPGVTAAAAALLHPPLDGLRQQRLESEEQPIQVGFQVVSGEYFETVGIDLLRGRLLDRRDSHDSPWTVVVNQVMAERHWPDADPLGQTIEFAGEGERPRQVVGVVENIANQSILRERVPGVYAPFTQRSGLIRNPAAARIPSYFLVRSSANMDELMPAIRREVDALHPGEAVRRITLIETWMEGAAEEVVLGVFLLGPLVGFTVILSAFGIYGVLAYATAKRTHEIGVRIALGADRGDLLGGVLLQGLRLAGWGLLIGAVGSFVITRLVGAQIQLLGETEWMVFAGAVAVALIAAGLAAYIPARRATLINPVQALRYE